MADQLATLQDLANALQINIADLDSDVGTLLLECGTAVVQDASGGQRIVQVVDDPFEVLGTTDSWLDLPQIPVTVVDDVELDGVALTVGIESTNYRLIGSRLWRIDGWQTYVGMPSVVTGLSTHGYASGSWHLQSGRNAVLSLAKANYPNPSGVASESIDDYNVTYQKMSEQMDGSSFLKASLRKKYGLRGRLVRLG